MFFFFLLRANRRDRRVRVRGFGCPGVRYGRVKLSPTPTSSLLLDYVKIHLGGRTIYAILYSSKCLSAALVCHRIYRMYGRDPGSSVPVILFASRKNLLLPSSLPRSTRASKTSYDTMVHPPKNRQRLFDQI